ncbi:MAG: ATP-binding protein [Peptostreptococcaceae bacterium]
MKVLLNSIDNYVLVLNSQQRITFCNDKLLRKLGFSEDEIYKYDILKLLKNQSYNDIKYLSSIKEEEKINIDLALKSKGNGDILFNADILIKKFEGKKSIFIIAKEITEKYYTKEDLEQILDNIPYSIWVKDKDSKYKYTNEKYAKLNKKDKQDIIGKYDYDLWDAKTSDYFKLIDNKVLKNKTAQEYEECINRGDGDEWFETYKAPIFDKEKNEEYVLGQTKNITLNKVLNRKAENKFEKISQLEEILSHGYNKMDNENLLQEFGQVIFENFKVDTLAIQIFSKDNKQFKNAVILGEFINILGKEEIDINDYNLKEMLKTNVVEGIKRFEEIKNPHIKEVMLKNNINYMGIYKIMYKDEILGLLSIYYKEKDKVIIIRDDYVKSICNQMGIYLKNKYLLEDLSVELKNRKELERDLQDFVDISVDLVGKFTIDGKIIEINNKWIQTLGWTEDEFRNKNILDLVHPNDLLPSIETVYNQENISGYNTNRMLCKDGTYKNFKWNYKIIRDKHIIVATARDITKEIEEEKKKQKLEETIKLESFKNEFFANLSHEFKTPLNIILSSIQLLNKRMERDNIEEDNIYRRYSRLIRQNSYRLLRLVNNLIDITRIDSNYYELQLENCNIVNIIENITLSVAQYIEDKGINLIFDTNYEEQIIACDQDKIERILLNLLSNAVKYTNRGGEIFVNLIVENNKVIISVKDSGIGIEEEKLQSIFERFKRVDDVLSRRCEGSGIGLSLVKALVELHDGKIDVNSEVNKGTEFIFEIPITLVESKEVNLLTDYSYDNIQIEKCNIEFSDIYS